MTDAPKKENICAVVVTFNPGQELIDEIHALTPQVKHIVIVDNGSAAPFKPSGVTFITNKENKGQGAGLNQGIGFAKRHGFSWVLMMDQDSLPDASMAQELIKAYRAAAANIRHIALIGTNFTYRTNGRLAYKRECDGRGFFERAGIQISGSLLSLDALAATGAFREDFFIDYIDTEYCLRLKLQGLKGIIACKAHMLHGLGKEGGSKVSANYSPLRRYYRTRNELTLLKEYARKAPLWTLKHIGYMLYEWTLILATEEKKGKKLKAALQGVKDALQGKMGK